jgi:hypothetical protein
VREVRLADRQKGGMPYGDKSFSHKIETKGCERCMNVKVSVCLGAELRRVLRESLLSSWLLALAHERVTYAALLQIAAPTSSVSTSTAMTTAFRLLNSQVNCACNVTGIHVQYALSSLHVMRYSVAGSDRSVLGHRMLTKLAGGYVTQTSGPESRLCLYLFFSNIKSIFDIANPRECLVLRLLYVSVDSTLSAGASNS